MVGRVENMNWMVTRRVVCAALLAVCCGCDSGSPVGKVSGRVTYDGEPLVGAEVRFAPVGEGRRSIGFVDDGGDYALQYTLDEPGALIGRHKVTVVFYQAPGDEPIRIPAKYSNGETEFEVRAGNNRLDIDLKSNQ